MTAAPERRTVAGFLVVSLLVHGLLLVLPLPNPTSPQAELSLLPVELLPPPSAATIKKSEPKQKQIVSSSEVAREEEPVKPTRLLSERSSRVAEETIHRGMPAPGASASQTRPQARTQLESRSQETHTAAPRVSLANLFKSPGELVRSEKRRKQREKVAKRTQKDTQSTKRRLDLALAGLGAISPALAGVPDYLPEIRPGQFTLLNAKANRFAPFVRRVGMRVFQHLLIAERHLAEREILAAEGRAVVRAVLSQEGKLVELTTEGLSGSSGLDKTLRQACQKGAFDNNPPKGAQLPDGTYEFLFEARLRPWSMDGQRVGRVDSFLSIRLL